MDNSKIKKTNGKELVFYRGNELEGYSVKGEFFSGSEMLRVYRIYEVYLKNGRYKAMRDFEIRNEFPREWLTRVVAGKILDERRNEQGKSLVKEFSDRGFIEEYWIRTENIKAKEAGREHEYK